MIAASLAPHSAELDKMFKFSGGKAIRKYRHGKANPYLKGVQKPLIKYAETSRLNSTEALEIRDALLQKKVHLECYRGDLVIVVTILLLFMPGFFLIFLIF